LNKLRLVRKYGESGKTVKSKICKGKSSTDQCKCSPTLIDNFREHVIEQIRECYKNQLIRLIFSNREQQNQSKHNKKKGSKESANLYRG
jgi:hypothetical protein